MPLLVDLPPEIESLVHEVALAEGLDVSALVRETLEARVRQYDPTRPLTESDLLMRINRGFSEAFWDTYRTLIAKRRAETLTDKEQQELIGMSDQLEAWHVERLRYLIKLAELRQVSLDALTQQLGLHPMPVE
jgi:hypothetical protein